ncbi:Platinum sensitivity protein [Xylographa soralifera]|nr:Platinum sensitivity protein [Xylographa soralifera]
MALVNIPQNDRKRVKVYELRNNDWFDRGTGFCTGQVVEDESKIYVESEDHPDRILLETKITKDDGFQKQQDTLIVWTANNGTDMALSFQEAEGCAAIWEFVSQVQAHLLAISGPDDALSDDAMDSFPNPVMLPFPELGNLAEIDQMMRVASSSPQGRDSLSKFVISEDYISKLVPLVETAEDLEALPELHRLSNIMKMLILLNDTHLIEIMVNDANILGVVGALEYDAEFPHHKANHREYLRDSRRFKEVVPIQEEATKTKIHSTWRLQYLKDVVLARILDDPTFSVLNSLIFFNQVDIVNQLQIADGFLNDLFGIIDSREADLEKKKDAVHFIQQCCAIAKNLQAPARGQLYTNFVQNGLLEVINFALLANDVSFRIAGSDILVAMIDHDPAMVRAYIYKSINENKIALTDTLIDLLLNEVDLGVKAQASDAIKVLLDPQSAPQPPDNTARANTEFLSKIRGNGQPNPQESLVQSFYDNAAQKLFQPLKDLETRDSVQDLTLGEVSLFIHLVEILMFFIRQHLYRSKFFIAADGLPSRIAQLLACPQKHLKLTALKFFRTSIGLQDPFFNEQVTKNFLFEPILNIVYETMPRDNLLNSACLELFEFIKRENIKPMISHVVENYRPKLEDINYVTVFEELILRYDQMQGYNPDMEGTIFPQEEDSNTQARPRLNGASQRWQGVREMDAAEEEYFNTSDDEDELAAKPKVLTPSTNGASPVPRPLVDYPSDDDEAVADVKIHDYDTRSPSTVQGGSPSTVQADTPPSNSPAHTPSPKSTPVVAHSPLERLSEKRRREEDEEDELGKLSLTKRRGSSISSTGSVNGTPANFLRRKKSFASAKDANGGKKIAISLAVKSPIDVEHGRDHGG